MNEYRFVITERMWALMEPHCLGKPSDPGRTGSDCRMFMEAVLWIVRADSPWRDLPPQFAKWNAIFKRFREWVKRDVFYRIFNALSDEPDMQYAMIDATIIKVHRHGEGSKGSSDASTALPNPKTTRSAKPRNPYDPETRFHTASGQSDQGETLIMRR